MCKLKTLVCLFEPQADPVGINRSTCESINKGHHPGCNDEIIEHWIPWEQLVHMGMDAV